MILLSDGDFLVTGVDNGSGSSHISGAYLAKVNADGRIYYYIKY